MRKSLPFILFILLVCAVFIPQSVSAIAVPIVARSFSGHDGAATTSHAIPLATGRAPNDLSMVCDDFNIQTTITWPAGWALIAQGNAGTDASNGIFSCAYRFTVLGDSDTVTVTTSGSVDSTWVGYLIVGADPGQRILAITAQANNANPDPPAAIVSFTTSLVVAAYGWGNSAFASLTAYPSGYSANPIKDDSHLVSSASAAMSTRNVGAGTEDPGTATLDTAVAWASTTIMISGPNTGASNSDLWLLLLLLFFFLLTYALAEDSTNPIWIVAYSLFMAISGILLAIQTLLVVSNSILSILIAALAILALVRGVFRTLNPTG